MLAIADIVRNSILTFIAVIATLLLLLLLALIAQRVLRQQREARRRQLERRYASLVEAWLAGGDADALAALASRVPASHREIVGLLLIAPLRALSGAIVERAARALDHLGIAAAWTARLNDRRWWRRAEAARALGLARIGGAAPALVLRLEDEHEEVRAAAVDALGRIRDESTLPALVRGLGEGHRQQRVRVVDALCAFGGEAAVALVRQGAAYPAERRLMAEALAAIGSGLALPALLEWTADADAQVRASALAAMAAIGLDDRAYYFALRALDDPDPEVRAMAARALGRSGRADAGPYLARRLDDEWLPAAHAADALRRLGAAGRTHLAACAAGDGAGAELARQMMWGMRADA